MDEASPVDLRLTFDRAADSYHGARPHYPAALFGRLAELLPPTPSIVEVGPGTGQATQPLLERGATVHAIEIGPRLAKALTQRHASFVQSGQLDVVVADFERVAPIPDFADAVLCATAYHWISPGEQLARPPRWLRSEGRLAIIDTMQVDSPADGGYFAAAQAIYEAHGQATGRILSRPDTVTPPMHERMTADPGCVDVTLDRYRWDQTYSAAAYRELLNTYSGTLAMPEPARSAMVGELVELADAMGGRVTRPLVITLVTCRFADPPEHHE